MSQPPLTAEMVAQFIVAILARFYDHPTQVA